MDKEIVHSGMPTKIENAKIALLNSALEIEKTELSAEIRITDPTQMQMFLEEENRMLKAMVDKLHDVGANVLICQKELMIFHNTILQNMVLWLFVVLKKVI